MLYNSTYKQSWSPESVVEVAAVGAVKSQMHGIAEYTGLWCPYFRPGDDSEAACNWMLGRVPAAIDMLRR